MTQPLLQAADLRGAARLTTDAVAGLTVAIVALPPTEDAEERKK